jgi:hypothetical protein
MIDDFILEAVWAMINEKTKQGITPLYITKVEFMNQVIRSLNQLYKDGKIEVGDTLNDKYIKIK